MVSVIIAIIAIAILCGGAMVLAMVVTDRSASRNRLDPAILGAITGGVALLLFALLTFVHTHSHARVGAPMHHKHGVFTPTQGYLASGGLLIAGAAVIMVAVHRRGRESKDSGGTPTI